MSHLNRWPLLILASVLAVNVPAVNARPAAREAPPVLLANVYAGEDINFDDYWVSEKYDGMRAWWDGQRLLTRGGVVIKAPPWFTKGWPATPLDGELWIARGEFETLIATARDSTPDELAWRRVKFMAFDLPAHGGAFTERLAALNAQISALDIAWLAPVPQFKVADRRALREKLKQVVDAGGEGLMLHRGASRYQAGRSGDLLKVKLRDDAEARVIGYSPGRGKYMGMLGALRVERADGVQFKLGTGFSDAQRRNPPPLGSWVTYTHHGTTAKGAPRFARFLRVRGDVIVQREGLVEATDAAR